MSKEQFYKLKPFDKKRLEEILSQEKIWLAQFNTFNDPFEGKFRLLSIPSPYNIEKNEALFQHYLKFHQKSDPTLSESEFRRLLNSSDFNQEIKNSNNEFISNLFPNHGSFCFTRDYSNPPMWAHYANEHKGYALIFELDLTLFLKGFDNKYEAQIYKQQVLSGQEILVFGSIFDETLNFIFTCINYQTAPPIIDPHETFRITNEYEQTKYLVAHSIGIKSLEWSYEQAFRLTANQCGLLDLEAYTPFLKITGIIIGVAMPEEEKKICHDLCEKNQVSLHQAQYSTKWH